MAPAWSSRDVAITLPIAEAEAMFARAKRFDIDRGGRFDRRDAAVLIWSAGQLAEDAEPTGCFFVRWRHPVPSAATIYRLEWDAAAGGSEAEVWRALEVLAGHPLAAP
jgi:hypothetical protein